LRDEVCGDDGANGGGPGSGSCCPFNCTCCAQRVYNLYDNDRARERLCTDEQRQRIAVRTRGSGEALQEIRDKFHHYGIRQFAFYENRSSIKRNHFWAILEGIVNDRTWGQCPSTRARGD